MQQGSFTSMGALAMNPALLGAGPAGWAALGVGAALDIFQGRRNAKAEEEYNKAVRDNMVLEQTWRNRSLNARTDQEQSIMAEDRLDAKLQALQIMSRAKASAGENGVAGFSIDRMLTEIKRDGDRAVSNINANIKGTRQQLHMDKRGDFLSRSSRIKGLTGSGVNYTGILTNAAVQGAGAYIDAQ